MTHGLWTLDPSQSEYLNIHAVLRVDMDTKRVVLERTPIPDEQVLIVPARDEELTEEALGYRLRKARGLGTGAKKLHYATSEMGGPLLHLWR